MRTEFGLNVAYRSKWEVILSALHRHLDLQPTFAHMKQAVQTPKAPAAIGPYSQAVIAGGMVFTSGQIALDPTTGELEIASLESETHQVMRNLSAVLAASGSGFDKVVKTSIFLSDMAHFGVVNGIYASYFSADAILPARETVQVAGLPKAVNVEISMIALV